MGNSDLFTIQEASAESVLLAEVDVDYEGPLDILTGSPAAETDVSQQPVTVSDDSTYDTTRNLFCYPVSGGEGAVYASVASGMVTTNSVTIQPDEGLNVTLYRNGKKVNADFNEPATQAGRYDLVTGSTDTENNLFSFMIVSKKTGALTNYQLPSGFYLTEVVLDGEKCPVRNTALADLSAEGEYQITYQCVATGADYHLDITVDHTPPEFVCEGVKDGVAHGPVIVTGIGDSDTVTLFFEDKQQKLPSSGRLTSPGDYRLTVTDDAGNAVSEEFTIQMYLNAQGLVFSLVVLALAAALGIYAYVTRKRLRVK